MDAPATATGGARERQDEESGTTTTMTNASADRLEGDANATSRTSSRRRPVLVVAMVVLFAGSLLGATLVGGQSDGDATGIDSCRVITESGTYVLEGNLTGDGSTCLEIDADDVVVDGRGYEIGYDGTDGSGMETVNGTRSNLTVKHVVFDGWDSGLLVNDVDGVGLYDVEARGSASAGIRLRSSSNVSASGVTVTAGADNGIDVYDTVGATLSNLAATNNGDGIYVQNSSVTIEDSNTATNTNSGILADGSSTVTVVDTVVHDNKIIVQDATVTGHRVDIGASTAANTTLDFDATNVQLGAVTNATSRSDDQLGIGRYVETTDGGSGSLEVDIYYDADDIVGVNASSLAVWRYDSAGSEWVEIDSTVDTENRLVSSEVNVTTGFGEVGVFGEPGTETVEVSNFDAPDAATHGETITSSATVTNTGNASGTQTIEYRFDGVVEKTTEVTLEPDESRVLEFDHTIDADAGTYTHGIYSDDDEATASIDVSTIAYRDLSVSPSELHPGETITADATLENVGGRDDAYNASLVVDGEVVDWENGTLAGGETTTVSFQRALHETGDHEVAIASLGPETVTVAEPAHFAVSIAETNAPVEAGDPLEVTVEVTNTGDVEGTQAVTLEANGSVRDSRTVTLAGGETTAVTLTWTPSSEDVGTQTVVVASDDESDRTDVEVASESEPEPDPDPEPGSGGGFGGSGSEPSSDDGSIAVATDDANRSIVAGETLAIEVVLENSGEAATTDELSFAVAGIERDSRTVTLAAGETATLAFAWETNETAVGTHQFRVESSDDDASGRVRVLEPGAVSVTIATVEPAEPVEPGANLTVTAVAENVGEAGVNDTIAFLVDGIQIDAADVTFDGGGRETLTFTHAVVRDVDGGENGTASLNVTVRSENDFDARTLEVRAAPEDPPAADPPAGSGGEPDDDEDDRDDEPTDGEEVPPESDDGDDDDEPESIDPEPDDAEDDAGSPWPTLPEWTDSAVDYEPSPQTQHVGGFAWLTLFTSTLAGWVALTRDSREASVLAATLALASLRTTSDVVHAVVDGFWILEAPLASINVVLELCIAVAFLRFAALYADERRLTDRRASRAMIGFAVLGTALVLTNPIHSLVFTEFTRATMPFTYASGQLGPIGWLLLASNLGFLAVGAGVLVRSLRRTDRSAWRPVGVLAVGICLAIVIGGLSALERGPLGGYDYTAAGVSGFVLLTTVALLGHGLHRIAVTAAQSLVEDLEDAIVILDDARTVVECNAAARRLIPGLEPGVAFEAVFDEPPAVPAAGETATTDVSGAALVGVTATDDGRPAGDWSERTEDRYFQVQTTAVSTGTSDTIGYTVRFADVTDLKRRTTELARKNEQLDQFASTVTHDLRNPLTVAMGYVDLLTDAVDADGTDPLDRKTLALYLEHVSSSLERMRTIIDDILALARNESVTDPRPVRFESIVESARGSVDTGDATIAVDDDGTIDADRDRLQRLLENLFRNAVEHAGRDVSIATGLTDDGFYVADDGPGIPADARDRIFEHGYSGDAAGTGLGLAIVERLATAHGWRVRLDPAHEGARFVFTGCETRLEGTRLEGSSE